MSIVLDGTTGITTPQVTTDDGEAYAPGNILGTVSESGGVPTGAIIERGSNANGEFVKYADGTMICHKRFIASDLPACNVSTTILGLSGFRSASTIEWTYPATFVTSGDLAISVHCTRSDRDTLVINIDGGVQASRTDGWSVVANASLSAGFHPTMFFQATGRWF